MQRFHLLLALGMLITGSLNTISTKAADNGTAVNRYGDNVAFNHPFVQAAGMFIGEYLCMIVYLILSYRAKANNDDSFARAKPHSRFIYAIPAMCDMTGTSLMYMGLSLTSSSVFQMLRGRCAAAWARSALRQGGCPGRRCPPPAGLSRRSSEARSP